ncbi:hypothetical protein CBL_08893 [Carabus blaptoides fortunei]
MVRVAPLSTTDITSEGALPGAMQTVPVLADIDSCQTPVYARLTSVQSEPQGFEGQREGGPEAWVDICCYGVLAPLSKYTHTRAYTSSITSLCKSVPMLCEDEHIIEIDNSGEMLHKVRRNAPCIGRARYTVLLNVTFHKKLVQKPIAFGMLNFMSSSSKIP